MGTSKRKRTPKRKITPKRGTTKIILLEDFLSRPSNLAIWNDLYARFKKRGLPTGEEIEIYPKNTYLLKKPKSIIGFWAWWPETEATPRRYTYWPLSGGDRSKTVAYLSMIFGNGPNKGELLLREFYKQCMDQNLHHVQLQYLYNANLAKCYQNKGFSEMSEFQTRSGGTRPLLNAWGYRYMYKMLTKEDVKE